MHPTIQQAIDKSILASMDSRSIEHQQNPPEFTPQYYLIYQFFPMLQMDPTFVRIKNGHPIPTLENQPINRCFQLIDAIKQGQMLPEYVILNNFDCAGPQKYCMDICLGKFEGLNKYKKVADIITDTEFDFRSGEFNYGYQFIYRLDVEKYRPF